MLILLSLLGLSGCGKKGSPQPPLVFVPGQITDLASYRLGSNIYVQFTVPLDNEDSENPTNVFRIDLHGLTIDQVDLDLSTSEFVELSTLVASIDIKVPLPVEEEEEESIVRVEDDRPGLGESVTVIEPVTPDLLIPVKPEQEEEPEPDLEDLVVEQGPRLVSPELVLPIEYPPLRRMYLAVAVSGRGRLGPESQRVATLLTQPPGPPFAPRLRYNESAITVEWESMRANRRRMVQESSNLDDLEGKSTFDWFSWPPTSSYNVYQVSPYDVYNSFSTSRDRPIFPEPLNSELLETTSYEDSLIEFGVKRCYVVRAHELYDLWDGLAIQSEESPLVCVTPEDVFPPAGPVGLVAVSNEGAISLIWEISAEEDFGGYLIFRGSVTDETLRPLTEVPIFETTYLDTTVEPGTSYVYEIVAIDSETPPNESSPSNRVEELAR